ncbi:hypothetical protein [Gordonia terrae]|uniref:Uncharacterized protein n=1 Tax=Gordonia terrae NBRC 100016 TaxID=1089454 RepID=A0ABQ0H7N5_9ACTN|nr:hypothetical protein [Gordonia terrae]ANY26079.1 hypothetical protein BCM27_13760 [Gordonia terrae]GAB41890.1 hypothetical protein GOTRE_001_01390 [Gordonia terrae NBRC 100016]VTR02362.1 Uncharacterised protein [Clostridioides difficile]VTS54165.1 Uncharacterised protein [Gordonia terrae]
MPRPWPPYTVVALIAVVGLISPLLPRADAQPGTSTTGFAIPFAGAPAFAGLAPPKSTVTELINEPLGAERTERIAAGIGLSSRDALSAEQFRELTTGSGIGGRRDAAQIIDACLQILTNSAGRPMFGGSVLGSYGLYVTRQGLLQSPANASAPTRQVNSLLAPGGYVGTWLRANGATDTLVALYRSAYTVEVPFGFVAQQTSGAAQLVRNTKDSVTTTVGMSMAPPLWIVNFALLYVVKPSLAAAMPAYWTPIPPVVAAAIEASPTGQVPYAEYENNFG